MADELCAEEVQILQALASGHVLIKFGSAFVMYGYGGKLGEWSSHMVDHLVKLDLIDLERRITRTGRSWLSQA